VAISVKIGSFHTTRFRISLFASPLQLDQATQSTNRILLRISATIDPCGSVEVRYVIYSHWFSRLAFSRQAPVIVHQILKTPSEQRGACISDLTLFTDSNNKISRSYISNHAPGLFGNRLIEDGPVEWKWGMENLQPFHVEDVHKKSDSPERIFRWLRNRISPPVSNNHS